MSWPSTFMINNFLSLRCASFVPSRLLLFGGFQTKSNVQYDQLANADAMLQVVGPIDT